MCLKEGILSPPKVIEELRLDKNVLESSDYVTIKEYNLVSAVLIHVQQRLNLEKKKVNDLNYRIASLREEIEEKEKIRERERTVERILGLLLKSCEAKISLDDKVPWVLTINEISDEGWEVFSMIEQGLDSKTRKMLKQRLRGGTDEIKSILEFIFRKRKSVTDRIREEKIEIKFL